MTNKHEWVGTSGLKQLLLMLVDFIYLLWQWHVMQRKGVQLSQQVRVETLLSQCSKRERERESRIVTEWTRRFCLPGTSEDSIVLHRCHRSHHRYTSIERGHIPANKEEHNQCNATIWCMIMIWQYAMSWADTTKIRLNEVGLNPRFKFKLHMWLFKWHLTELS